VLILFSDFTEVFLEMIENSDQTLKKKIYNRIYENLGRSSRKYGVEWNEKFYSLGIKLLKVFEREDLGIVDESLLTASEDNIAFKIKLLDFNGPKSRNSIKKVRDTPVAVLVKLVNQNRKELEYEQLRLSFLFMKQNLRARSSKFEKYETKFWDYVFRGLAVSSKFFQTS
jgi:hypothetical protein